MLLLVLTDKGSIIYTMIKISLNRQLDYETYDNFKNFSVAGADFGATIKRDHPAITKDNFKDYIDKFYKDNAEVLKKACDEINTAIISKQRIFFESVEKIFDIDASGENFRGYISIFNCNPRFVESKEFQIFYKKEIGEKIEVVFHEILHFIFFDYCSKKISQEIKNLDRNSGKLWELSEIVNVIILNLQEFRTLIGREEKLFYPNLKEKLTIIQDIWNKNHDMKKFIEQSLKNLN